MRILFITNIPSPNRVAFFNEFGKLCDLTVTFELVQSSERDKQWVGERIKNFQPIFLKGKRTSVDAAICPGILNVIRRNWDYIILNTYYTPTSMLAMQYMMLTGRKYWLEADGGFSKQDKRIKYLIKHHFLSKAEEWFSTGEITTDYLCYYGAIRGKCHVFPFTSIRKAEILDMNRKDYIVWRDQQRKAARKKLNIQDEFVALTVSQIIPRKGLDVLIKATNIINKKIGYYIVGGQATVDLNDLCSSLFGDDNPIHFEGFKKASEVNDYYMAADVLIFPTREDIWGLVVNEAMGAGLPVITTNRCGAGLELIENEKNGYIVPADDVEALARSVNNIFADKKRRSDFGKNSLSRIQKYTLEEMAETHMEVLRNYEKRNGNHL